jgi:hypothetical protein
MNMHADGNNSINAYLSDTIASVFSSVCTVDVPDMTNRELFASRQQTVLSDRLQTKTGIMVQGPLKVLLESMILQIKPHYSGTHILTDDKAPVELLGMAAMDNLVRNNLAQYRATIQQQGVMGALKMLY